MRLRWGNYSHRIAEANLQITRDPITNHAGVSIAYRETWAWSGRVLNKTQDPKGILPVLEALDAAYSQNGQDLVLLNLDGTPSYHALRSRDCIGGTRVVKPPQFTQAQGGEYVRYRTYEIAVEGIKPVLAGGSVYTEFTETISISGGAARFGCKEVNRGPGVRQQLRTHSKCVATQTGSATAYVGFPSVPGAIWPSALVDQLPDLSLVSPRLISGGVGDSRLVDRKVTWTYRYEWPLRLFGEPHYLLR